jgi:hypothetical protein
MTESIIITETVNDIIVSSPGPQGPRGKTILNGNGAPADNLGLEGDFYYDKEVTRFYGPKLTDNTWSTAFSYVLNTAASYEYTWEMASLSGPTNGIYAISITHNLGYRPNVTVKSSAGDVLETGIDYNSINKLTLTMAQPFSGTAYMS